MKQLLFLLYLIIGVLLFGALIILPEYRLRIIFALFLYVFILFFILRFMMIEHIKSFYYLLFSRRFKSILLWTCLFIFLVLVSVLILKNKNFARFRFDFSKDELLTITSKTVDYLKQIDTPIEVIYIRPVNKEDNRNLFNSIMEEFRNYTDKIECKTIHPVLNTVTYNEIRNKLPTAAPGSVVVFSGSSFATSSRISEHDLISTIYRAREGRQDVCFSRGHGEPSFDDFSENGAAIIAHVLKDRGINLVYADVEEWSRCNVLVILDPREDFSTRELSKLNEFDGQLIIIGGAGLKSVNSFIEGKGIYVSKEPISVLNKLVVMDYSGGMIIDNFSEHPIIKTVKGSVVVASSYALRCKDCLKLAAISSTSSNEVVLVMKGGLQVFSVTGVASNFFMRFKGNSELVTSMINYAISPEHSFIMSTGKGQKPLLFAISPRYLNIIFVLTVLIVPLLILLLSICCFRILRVSKA